MGQRLKGPFGPVHHIITGVVYLHNETQYPLFAVKICDVLAAVGFSSKFPVSKCRTMPFDVKATAVQLENDWACNNDNAWFANWYITERISY